MGSVKGVTIREGSMEFIRQAKLFASTEGAVIEQELFESGAGIEATATSPDEVQNRSYPNSFGRHQGSGGYEYVTALELDQHGQRIGEEAVALLTAPQCPSGVRTLILDASQTALQIHESCGHPTELDRVFGMEAAYAGTSFMTPEKHDHGRRADTDGAGHVWLGRRGRAGAANFPDQEWPLRRIPHVQGNGQRAGPGK